MVSGADYLAAEIKLPHEKNIFSSFIYFQWFC